jgi:cell filamentation protein, protein adenylyltransferase
MDISTFGIKSPGELVAIGGGDHAFVPAPLPPSWEFPVTLWPMLARAKEQVALLEGVGRTLPNPGLLLQPLASREAIQSSRLEGTYASPRELLLFELEPREAKPGEEQVNDWREVLNNRRALEYAISSRLPVCLRLVREMHRILLSGVRGKERAPGEFRRVQVAIGANQRFVPPPPDRLRDCLDALEKSFHASSSHDPLIDCFLCHYQFETIHPFMDGNGRVGRLLLAVMLQERCSLTKPWLYLSEFFEKHRDEYCQRLFQVSAEGDWEHWLDFCLRGTIAQATATVKRCERLRQTREKCMQQLARAGGSVRLNQIVEGLFHSPYVRVTDVAKQLHVTYPTAKADIDRLVKARILKPLKNTSQKTYYAPLVYDAAYKDIEEPSNAMGGHE